MVTLHASWLNYPHCQLALEALGAENMRYVGGVVRNSLMNIPVSDIDIATTHLPEKTMKLLEKKGFSVIPTGIEHGTITAVFGGIPLEITTLRQDVETDGRRAKVAFTNEWHADAARRDFTMNAIYASGDGSLYDPCDGLADIKVGKVRFIGHAQERIKEDALRIMRLFRFQAYYGRVPIDDETLDCVESLKNLVANLSVERIANEFLKTLRAPAPEMVLDLMRERGILNVIFPSLVPDVEKLTAISHKGGERTRALRHLVALYGKAATKISKNLKFSKKQISHVSAILTALEHGYALDEFLWKQCIYHHGKSVALDALLIMHESAGEDFYDNLLAWQVPVFPLSGKDILAIGIKSGPVVGKLLKEREKSWITSEFKATKAELLKDF